MKINVNALEQYGRRNSLRFNNLTVNSSQKEDGVMRFININKMPTEKKTMIEMVKGVIHLEEK